MKTNIITIDEHKLEEAITSFESVTNQRAYIFMSDETASILEAKYKYLNNIILKLRPDADPNRGYIAMYNGNRIYIDNSIKFGEVDIR